MQMKTIKEKIILPVVVFFFTSLIGLGFTSYQNYQNQPRIIIDTTREYSLINGVYTGNIEVSNWGKSPDNDIVVIVYGNIENGIINTDGADENNKFEKADNQAKFTIGKLNPADTAVLSFSSSSKDTSYDIAYNSATNKIEETSIAPLWWEFNITQLIFIMTMLGLGFLIGVYLYKPRKQ